MKQSPSIINPKIFIIFYSVVPIFIILLFLDKFFIDNNLLKLLTAHPSIHSSSYYILFYPHLISGLMTFFDKEYLIGYKSHFISKQSIPFLFVLITAIFFREVFFFLFTLYGSFHLINQQLGIEKILSKTQKTYSLGIHIIFSLLITHIYLQISFPHSFMSLQLKSLIAIIPVTTSMVILFISFFLMSLHTMYRSRKSLTESGKIVMWGNLGMVILTWVTFRMEYFFLSFLIPRLIHDLTALPLYISHDINRNTPKRNNFLYALLPVSHSILLGSIILIPFFTNFLAQALKNQAIQSLFIILALFHYLSESFMWKKDSLHIKKVIINI